MALKLYVNTSDRTLVESYYSQRLGAILPQLVQGDRTAVRIHFLSETGLSEKPFEFLDYSSKSVKLALGRNGSIGALSSTWTPNPDAEITVSELSTTTLRVRCNLVAVDGTFELTFAEGETTKRTGAVPYNASAETVAAAVNALSLGQTVSVLRGPDYWDLTFPTGHAAFEVTGNASGLICEKYLEGTLNLNTEEIENLLGSSSSVSDFVLEIQVSDTEVESVQYTNVTVRNGLIDDVPPAPAVLDEYYNKEETDDLLDGKADAEHTHEIADVTGLQTELDSKLEASDIAGKADATDLTAHEDDTNNPHEVTKTQVGLGNVDNTSDVDKPVSTAQAAALAGKADTGHTHAQADVTNLTTDLAAKAPIRRPIVTETTTARTLALTDENSYIRFTNGSATTLTIPENATVAFPIGTEIDLFQAGDGQVIIDPDAAVTVVSKSDNLKLAGKGSGAVLKKVDTDTWDLVGDLTA